MWVDPPLKLQVKRNLVSILSWPPNFGLQISTKWVDLSLVNMVLNGSLILKKIATAAVHRQYATEAFKASLKKAFYFPNSE